MGFLSKLLGDDKAGKMAIDFIKDVVGDVRDAADSVQKSASEYDEYSASDSSSDSPSGFSWGEQMPAEENQYSFNGSYIEYFDQIFKSEFPEYRIEQEKARYGSATVFTFWQNGNKALVVELLSRSSSAYKLRSLCAAEGIPYLRYYYDYHGWWNTRSYVATRTRNALNS